MNESLIQQYQVNDENLDYCKVLLIGKIMTVPIEKVPTNFVPAVAVIRRGRALSGIIGRKGFVGCILLLNVKNQSLTLKMHSKRLYLSTK